MSAMGATCPECGAELPEGRPASRCPQCLISLGLDVLDGASTEARATPGTQPPPAGEVAPPGLTRLRRFGDYELLEEIARGGMGVVYKARQVSLDRLVAVKMILAGEFATPQFVQRFRTEAAAAAVLHHPNIVTIHEVGVHAGQHYFTMDFVDGPNLAALVGHVPLPARRAAQYVKAIAEAVDYAHQQGILHRDLKPSNVLIDSRDQPRVMDFGLAKRLEGETSLTLSGQMVGSPNFMPPEQATARHGRVGRYSDVYAVGGILYHLLTARPPFQADSLEVIVSQVLTAEPVSPRLLNPTVPRDLETICLKCLEKEPARRYGSAQGVADELGRFLEGKPIAARPVRAAGKVWKWCQRKPTLAGMGAALVLTIVLGMAGILWQWHRATSGWLLTRQNAYAGDMRLAQLALENNNRRLAVEMLSKHLPADFSLGTHRSPLAADLRHWEWRYLWQLCQAHPSVKLQTNPAWAEAAAISRDGRVIAVKTGGAKIAVWDLTTRHLRTELPTTSSAGTGALSPTGGLLGVGTRNARGEPLVEVWDVKAQSLKRSIPSPSPVRSLGFSPDEAVLATFDDQGAIAIVEWATDQVLTNLTVPVPRHGGAGIVGFSPDGSRLVIGEDYGCIRILNWRTGAGVVRTNLSETGDGVLALAFSPASELVAAGFGHQGGAICLWDASSGEPRGKMAHPGGVAQSLAFSPDGRWLASAGNDRTIRIWNVADQVELNCLPGHESEGMALAFLPDGKTLVSGCKQTGACFWDVSAAGRPSGHSRLSISFGAAAQLGLEARSFAPQALDPKAVRRFGFAFAPDGGRFITTDREGVLGVWNTHPLRQLETLPALGSNCWGVALSPDNRWLAAGSASGKVTVWDWTARRAVTNFTVPFEWCGLLRFSHSGKFLLARVAGNDRTVTVRIWRTNGWAEVPLSAAQTAGIWSIDLSPDDRLLAAGYANGAAKLWAFPSGQSETTFFRHKGAVPTICFSPHGRLLASASLDGHVGLWDVRARRQLAPLPGHLAYVWGAAFSPDGRRLATGGTGTKDAVKLWDLATQREVLALSAEGDFFLQVVFSPDGGTLMTTSYMGVAHLWQAPSWAEIEATEKREVAP